MIREILLTMFLLSNLISKDTIIVSVPPQKYFVEQIANKNFSVKSMMDDNSILPNYKPTGQQYVWAENAVAYFKINMYDESDWINIIKRKNKKIKIFDTTLNTKQNVLSPYIWLDPILVRIQVKNIYNALIKLDPKNQAIYQKNYFKFVNRISRIDYQIKSLFKKNIRNHFMVFDPVWDYFSKRYKLKQLEINSNPFIDDDKNIVSILNQINKYTSNILFIPKYYFSKKILNTIKSKTKIEVVPFSHLEYNWESNILNIAKLITFQPINFRVTQHTKLKKGR